MIRRKKGEYKEKIVQDMSLSKGDHKTFWKLLEKIQKKTKMHSKVTPHQKDGMNIFRRF